MNKEQLLLLLPEVYQRAAGPSTPLSATLDVMAALHEPVEQVVADFPAIVDPWRTPDRFVPFLACWVGLEGWLDGDGEFETGVGRLRVAVAAAADLQRHRGTVAGLRQALMLALGDPEVRVAEHVPGPDGRPTPFQLRVVVPERAAPHLALIERIVAEEKAAHAVVQIVVAGTPQPERDPDGAA